MKKNVLCKTLSYATAAAVLVSGILIADSSYAQRVYPAKPVTLIVPFSAGGGTDIGARALISAAEKHFGQSFVIRNVEGGGSEVGISQMVRSAPDGYTIAAFNSASVVLTTMRKASYCAIKDISPIALVVSDPRLIVVRSDDKRFKTAKDFIQYARDNPDRLTIGTSGAGTTGHFSIEFMNRVAGVKAKPVHFRGAGESRVAFLGGHIDAENLTYGETKGMLVAGQARVILAATEERMKELPDVPTFREIGIDLVISSNRGFAAPRGTPKEIIDRLADAFRKASADPEYLKQMAKLGLPVRFAGPDEWAKLIKGEFEEYSRLVNDMGIKK